jgi:hypothetical protein
MVRKLLPHACGNMILNCFFIYFLIQKHILIYLSCMFFFLLYLVVFSVCRVISVNLVSRIVASDQR